MGEVAIIASEPFAEAGEEGRASRNFCINQLKNEGQLIWHVISTMGDEEISFDVKQMCSTDNNKIRFKDIKEGTVTPYEALRNLYIANPRNATGHFIVRIEPVH